MTSYEKTVRRIDAARANKQLWNEHIRECYEFAIPERNTIDQWSPGSKKNERVFDSTATDAIEDYANRMETNLVPATRHWIVLEAGTEIPEEDEESVDESLEQMTDILFNHINSSNFSSQIHECFLDLGISTGAIIIEAGDGIQSSLNFRSVSLSELIIERSQKGIIDTVWRDITVQAGDITTVWPTAKLSADLKQIITDKPSTDVKFIEGVMATDKGYEVQLLYPNEGKFLIQKNEESSPWVVFRESTIPGEAYGRGRVMRVLPDIKTLNKMVEDYLKALNFQANPIFTATDDGVFNPYLPLETGSVMVVGSNDNRNPSLSQMPITGNVQLLDFAIKSLQDVIRRTLLSKPFGNIEETPVRTATEMSMRNADNAQTSMGASGRIQSELLERLIARSVYVLQKQGKMPAVRVDGKEVAIKFTSPAAKQQDEQTLATIGRFMEYMQMIPPEVVQQKVNIGEVPKEVADLLGVPKRLLNTEAEQQEQAAQQQAQQQQLEAQALAAQGGNNAQQ